MGQLLGISRFDNYEESREMNRELNSAQRKERKAQKSAGPKGSSLRAVMVGSAKNPDAPASLYTPVMLEWMKKMRETFAPYVIRRTIDSLDHNGDRISGLGPYLTHNLELQMYDWEHDHLRKLSRDIVEEQPLAAISGASLAVLDGHPHPYAYVHHQNFYIEFRRSMLHPRMLPGHTWEKPASLDAWKASDEKSVKLDVLAEVVQHHLEKDSRDPLIMDDDHQTVKSLENADPTDPPTTPDKIVVYSAFPSSNQAILDIFALHGITALELNGSIPVNRRNQVLDEFRTSTRDKGSRVLILSNVGTVGLNLACANIMVIVDTLWSAQDDEQLRGRIYRFPQSKTVHIYRLIALGTPDVFLNTISFDKGQMHQAFVGSYEEIRKYIVSTRPAMCSYVSRQHVQSGR
ncbi:hypothetical protein HYDPIDRAFT_104092 [Hydnomerulius pinastri MD-312]|uniref:Helicase C-terminal domain-containing protein n=1 Tax=Hydnomerulius pinastri MD-312 TaxID=994086 RepID=A0A0C2PGD6_9AGAM|nr:hypothetical protein HYDPIDRAFT_104092 [Hydnomerulius pinastri MD-312]